MESLYRKYRPLTFDSVVGQQHIVSTLEHAITEGRLSHAYLFCGPRGTGKTTMARILAKALLCRNAEAARAEGASGCMPDGTCEECELIAEGNHPDVYELDAASRTGVDNVREEIINSVNFAPVRGKYKIYIIDEVHMLTTAAFNALLKTLEEPPAHVIFVLCTTDPQKILETILSRCQRFDFHRIGNEDIEHRLSYVCEQEGFDYDDEALAIVARHAKGGMRDALSILDQCIGRSDGHVTYGLVAETAGLAGRGHLIELAECIRTGDRTAALEKIDALYKSSKDMGRLCEELAGFFRNLMLIKTMKDASGLVNAVGEELEAMTKTALSMELSTILHALDAFQSAQSRMKTMNKRTEMEMTFIRLCTPEMDTSPAALLRRIEALERGGLRRPITPAPSVPAAEAPAAPVQQPCLLYTSDAADE